MKFPLSLLENICKFVSVTLILSIVDFAHSKLLPFNRFKSNHTNHFNHESVRSMRKVPINFGVETIHRWHVWHALYALLRSSTQVPGVGAELEKWQALAYQSHNAVGMKYIYTLRVLRDMIQRADGINHLTIHLPYVKSEKCIFPVVRLFHNQWRSFPVRINHLTIHLPYVPRMQISKNHYMVRQSKLTRNKLLYRSSGIHSAEQTSLHYGNRRHSRCKHRGRTKAFGSHHSTLLSLEFPSPLHSSSKASQVLGIGVSS